MHVMSEEFLISWHGATNLLQCKCILSIGNYQKVIIHKNNITIGEFDLLGFFSPTQKLNFIITDFKNEINVSYSGAVPNLFSEGKGVVAEGYLKDKSFFLATKILAKHDENYMPPEVKAALEEK